MVNSWKFQGAPKLKSMIRASSQHILAAEDTVGLADQFKCVPNHPFKQIDGVHW